jgi:hypothetical protein
MAMEHFWCPVRGEPIACRTDVDGTVTRVSCPDYGGAGICRRRTAALTSGPLAQFLERVSEKTLDDATTLCVIERSRSRTAE